LGRYAWNTGEGLIAADIALNGIKAVRAGLDEKTEYTPWYGSPLTWIYGAVDAITTPLKPQEKALPRLWIPE
jgi:hypothetical protein